MEQIQGRKKELKKLRKRDYKRFIWLLKELDLLYRPHPLYVDLNTRRARMQQYLREETCRIIREKINAVYTRLDSEKENFYTEKEKVLSEIRKDLSDHNISAYDVLQNVRKLRQERVVERQNKAPPTPNTYRWIQSDKDRKKAERRERDLHRNALVKKGMQKLAQSEEASWKKYLHKKYNIICICKLHFLTLNKMQKSSSLFCPFSEEIEVISIWTWSIFMKHYLSF